MSLDLGSQAKLSINAADDVERSDPSEASVAEWAERTINNLKSSNSAQSKYGGNAYFGGLAYNHLWVNVTDGAHLASFEGEGGGAGGGVGVWFGELYTDDIDRLYRDTISYSFLISTTYINVIFYDGNSIILGHFHGGGIAIAGMTGGGKGHWTKQ